MAGAYNLLPSAIEDLQGARVPPAGAKRQAAVQLLNHWLRVQLLQVCLMLAPIALGSGRSMRAVERRSLPE